MAGHHAVQVHRVVVAKRMPRGAGGMDTFPQRCMRHGVHIHRRLGVRNRLDQAGVGGITRLADKTVFLAHPLGQFMLQSVGGVVTQQERTGLDDKLIVLAQSGQLRAHNIGVTSDAKVVIAIKPDRIRARRHAVQNALSTPEFVPAGGEIPRNSLLQTGAQRGINGAGCEGFFNNFHGTPC